MHVLCCRDVTSDLYALSQVFGILLDAGADVNAKDMHGHTPLHYACHRSWHEEGLIPSLVSLLVSAGADVSASDNPEGFTPLHLAVLCHYDPNIADIMLVAGADINTRDHLGRTPLHHAARRATPNIAKRLISSGASADALDQRGDTPLTLAARAGSYKGAIQLLKAGVSACDVAIEVSSVILS
ncbi:hypothetical protein BOTBODRAFT_114842 [Botryobasidium botryosum FD-172 SS1]|uniref:Uncharacterized protein n=1 Tax=Botryobasidium botryosum (strain FD-172 SS1) TaxID=930990 RepID=A0A067M8Q1_BOTB1|nr:hypothetical protein BOTBODRAFT_114842 [Botryobasidium botryosum FD-172 SS1]